MEMKKGYECVWKILAKKYVEGKGRSTTMMYREGNPLLEQCLWNYRENISCEDGCKYKAYLSILGY